MTGQNASDRVVRSVTGAWGLVGRIPTRIRLALKDIQEAKQDAQSQAQFNVTARQADLVAFYAGYEELVELLCDSAQYGPDSKLEQRYGELREWMMAHYASVRPYALAYLQLDVSDAQRGLDWHQQGVDAFEALFAAPTLTEFLRVDDGGMILRIERTRIALGLYADHLRQLANSDQRLG